MLTPVAQTLQYVKLRTHLMFNTFLRIPRPICPYCAQYDHQVTINIFTLVNVIDEAEVEDAVR